MRHDYDDSDDDAIDFNSYYTAVDTAVDTLDPAVDTLDPSVDTLDTSVDTSDIDHVDDFIRPDDPTAADHHGQNVGVRRLQTR